MEEYPIREIPPQPFWSENFALAGFDPRIGVDVFMHFGRWRRDQRMWRELVTVALPDGTMIGHRGIGDALASANGPGGPSAAMEVIDPTRRMRWRYKGAAVRVPAEALLTALLPDGPLERVEFDLDYASDQPVWDLTKDSTNAFVGAGHVEQIGRVTGEIRIGADSFAFDSLANRDHSRGVRVVDSNLRHIWMHGIFENGLRFCAYEAEVAGYQGDGPAYSECCLIRDGRITPGRLTVRDHLPFTDNHPHIHRPVGFTIEAGGERAEITAERFPTTMHYQSTSPNDFYVGRRQVDAEQNSSVMEQAALYRLADGTAGFGHMERLVPGKLIVDPL